MRTSIRSWRGLCLAGAVFLGAMWCSVPISRADGKSGPRTVRTGEELYLAACASCHGVRGTGVDQSRLGVDIAVPDFTDCSFATREPNADWLAVAHDGGPARAFSRLMPAFGDALNTDELERILEHVRGFCRSEAWPRGELNLPRPLVTEKAYPEDEAVITTALATEGDASVSNKLVYEKRFGARNQFELIVPFGWNQAPDSSGQAGDAGSWRGGIGDIAAGVKRDLFHSLRHGFVSGLANRGVIPERRRAITGHRTEREHGRYTHHEIQVLREEINKLPSIPG